MTALWHPFADMSEVDRSGEFVLSRGSGQFVFDSVGRKYLDMTAGLWFANVGHGRQEIADAVAEQAAKLAAYSTFGDMANEPVLALAEKIAALSPDPASKVFFTSGGSDAVDTAVKLVRRYWNLVGHPERSTIITRDRAYHGMHWGGTGLAGIESNRRGHGDFGADVGQVRWDDVAALAAEIDRRGPENVAAFFCEPVMGAGGVFSAGQDYLTKAREVCRKRGVLWVSDEVITGFGRTGAWFASTRYQLKPDLMLTAKGLTSGYVPMGAVIASSELTAPFFSEGAGMWRHGYTYSGHAVAAAAGLANLTIIENERLIDRVARLEPVLEAYLVPLADHPLVCDVRAGVGLLAAVQIAPDPENPGPARLNRVVSALREQGVLTRGLVDGSMQISPPFVIGESDIEFFVKQCTSSLNRVHDAKN